MIRKIVKTLLFLFIPLVFFYILYDSSFTKEKIISEIFNGIVNNNNFKISFDKITIEEYKDKKINIIDHVANIGAHDNRSKLKHDVSHLLNSLKKNVYHVELSNLHIKLSDNDTIIIPHTNLMVEVGNIFSSQKIKYKLYFTDFFIDKTQITLALESSGTCNYNSLECNGEYTLLSTEIAQNNDEFIIDNISVKGNYAFDSSQLHIFASAIHIDAIDKMTKSKQQNFVDFNLSLKHTNWSVIHDVVVDVLTKNMPVAIVNNFLPKSINQVLNNNISNAVIEDGSLSLHLPEDFFNNYTLLDDYITNNIKIKNLDLHLNIDTVLPELNNGYAEITFNASKLIADVKSIKLGNTVGSGKVTYEYGSDNHMLTINGSASGDAKDLLRLIDKNSIDNLKKNKFDLWAINGVAHSNIHVVIDYTNNTSSSDDDEYDVTTTINALSGKIHKYIDIEQVNIKGKFDGDTIDLQVDGLINGSKTTSGVIIYVNPDNDTNIEIQCKSLINKASKIPNMQQIVSIGDGVATAHVKYTSFEKLSDTFDISVDISDLDFKIPSAYFVHARSPSDIDLRSVSLVKITGSYADNLMLANIKLNDCKADIDMDLVSTDVEERFTINKAIYDSNDFTGSIMMNKHNMAFQINGKTLNGEQLFATQLNSTDIFDSKAINIEIKATFDTMLLHNNIKLTNVLFYANESFGILDSLEFNANVGSRIFRVDAQRQEIADRQVTSQSTVLKQDKALDYMVFDEYFARDANEKYSYNWSIGTNNAGAMLKAFNVTNKMKAGTFTSKGTANVDINGNLIDINGIVYLKKFVITENRFLVQMLSSLSLPGLIKNFTKNKDISFKEFQANLHYSNKILNISNGLAHGPYFDFKLQSGILDMQQRQLSFIGATIPSLYGMTFLLNMLEKYHIDVAAILGNKKTAVPLLALTIINPVGLIPSGALWLAHLLVRPFSIEESY